ncbi:MAG TPA: hypothetical protein ENI07_08240 [Desulfobacterales bacterium]|nr:hypothetical protein [Desulfobacterales bacterium]
MESNFLFKMLETFNNLENQSNPWGFGSDIRKEMCKFKGQQMKQRMESGSPGEKRHQPGQMLMSVAKSWIYI